MDDPFAKSRKQARARAAEILREQSFTEHSDGSFVGEINDGDEHIAVRVEFPPRFPDLPPTISVINTDAISRRAHIEQKGKLCLFPQTGILVDVSRPEQVVLDSLQRAKSILIEAEDDYRAEFLAYWQQPYVPELLSIITDLERPHALAATETEQNLLVVGDNQVSLRDWICRVGWKATHPRNAFLVPLRELPDVPSFGTISEHRHFITILKRHAVNEDQSAFRAWLSASGLPAFLFLSAPSVSGAIRVVFAAKFCQAEGKAAIRLHKGFRSGKMPPSLEVARSSAQPAVRIRPHRADAEYVISRVGGDVALKARSVVIIGCGSLGSQIAVNLAATGVGLLTLIDAEQLSVDNVHRHVLGMSSVGRCKANALRDHILARFPHLSVYAIANDVELTMSRQPEILTDQNLTILATGDETLERRLNTFFNASMRRIHAWLEPLGVGGHALLTGPSECFNCVFESDEAGPFNLASLVGRGQNFLHAIDGCSSTFTPFGYIDAAQGAVEVTRLAVEVLQNEHASSKLVSWTGDPHQFQAAGYDLSRRGAQVLARGRTVENSYGRRNCEACRGQ